MSAERIRSALFLLVALAFARAASALAPDAPADIPFQLDGTRIVVDVKVNGQKTLPFAFDTGLVGGHIVTPHTAETLGLKTEAAGRFRDSASQRGDLKIAKVPEIALGTATLRDQTVGVTEIPDEVLQRQGKAPVAGFLGAPLLEGAVLCIDYDKSRLQRFPRGTFPSAGTISIPMGIDHGFLAIDIVLDGIPAKVEVDSGSNDGLTLHGPFIAKHDIPRKYPDVTQREGSSGSGQTFPVVGATVDKLVLGGKITLRQVPVSFVPTLPSPLQDLDGVMGYEVLSRIDPCLDRDGKKLSVKSAPSGT